MVAVAASMEEKVWTSKESKLDKVLPVKMPRDYQIPSFAFYDFSFVVNRLLLILEVF